MNIIKLVILVSLVLKFDFSYCQKPAIDLAYIGNTEWPQLREGIISPNGQIVAYTFGPEKGQPVLVVKFLETDKEIKIFNGTQPKFTQDSKMLNFDLPGDTLCRLNLVNQKIICSKKESNNIGNEDLEKIESRIARLMTDQFPEYKLINGSILLSNDGKKAIVTINKSELVFGTKKHDINLNVWSSTDEYLQTEQFLLKKGWPDTELYALYDVSKNILKVIGAQREILLNPKFKRYVLLSTELGGQTVLNQEKWPGLYLIDLNNANKKKIFLKEFSGYGLEQYPLFSPDEKYIIWFNADDMSYYSYDITTGYRKNISGLVEEKLYDIEGMKSNRKGTYGIAGWGKDFIYIYDEYDIWRIHLSGNFEVENITRGYGRANRLVLYFSPTVDLDHISLHEDLLLLAYDKERKQNGFCSLKQYGVGNLILHGMENSAIFLPNGHRLGNLGFFERPENAKPVKADQAGIYLVTKQNSYDAPNLFVTTDFKTFKRVSDIQPQKDINWLTTELITWTMTNGNKSSGILYKPQDFDFKKRYPVIFDFYERRSDQLHQFLKPGLSEARINIPYFVSNGYLVFVPDIYYTPGHIGEGTVNSVVSAAKYLRKFAFIDSTKMGLQGHSFGGFQTNFLVTHSNLFTAACEASGVSDVISGYGQLHTSDDYKSGFGSSRSLFYELASQGAPYGLNKTPWNDTNAYLRNSPVLFADKVNTPLLMMHGRKDTAVPFSQAIEFFTALKRAKKTVWLLDYEEEGHSLGKAAEDFTIRVKQFFDHYLKNYKAPYWMIKGIPYYQKGIVDGLDTEY